MKLDDMLPFVAPLAMDLPQPVLDQQIRAAAQDFFRRTHAWQVDIDAFAIVDGQTDYDFSLPEGLAPVKVLTCESGGMEFKKAVELHGNSTLRFSAGAMPAPGLTVTATLAVAPAIGSLLKAWTWPDEHIQYADDIAHGALALILIKSDRGEAELRARLFANRISVVGLKVSRQLSGKSLRGSAAQFY